MPQNCLSLDPPTQTRPHKTCGDLKLDTGHHHGGLNINTGCWQQADRNLSLHNQEKQNYASKSSTACDRSLNLKGYKSSQRELRHTMSEPVYQVSLNWKSHFKTQNLYQKLGNSLVQTVQHFLDHFQSIFHSIFHFENELFLSVRM